MKFFLKKRRIIFILFLVAIFARFIKISDLYYFMMDEERDIFIASNILRGKLTLIGGSVPGGLFLGPLYFYITSFFLLITGLNPFGLAFIASSFGVVSTILLYKTTKLFIEDEAICFFSSLLYATSYLISIYNRTYWPLTFAPIVTILTINFLYRVISLKDNRFIIPLGLVQLLGMQSDPSNFSSLIVVLILFLFYKAWNLDKKKILFVAFFIFVAHLPLVAFDLRHDFYIAQKAMNFISMKQPNIQAINLNKRVENSTKAFNLVFNTFSRVVFVNKNYDVTKQITISPESLKIRDQNIAMPLKILVIFSLLGFYFFAIKENNIGLKILSLQFAVIIFGIMTYSFIFPGYMHEWFLNVFWPGFCIIFVYPIFSISSNRICRKGIFFFLLILCFLNLINIATSVNSLGYKNKIQAIEFIKSEAGKEKDYSLEGSLSWAGFEYLLRMKQIPPKKSAADDLLNGWLYEKPKKLNYSKTIVVVLSPDELKNQSKREKILNQYLKHKISQKVFGGYLVMIVDNSSHWR